MWYTQQLILHGAVVLLIGLICGAPLGSAVVRAKPGSLMRLKVDYQFEPDCFPLQPYEVATQHHYRIVI